MPKLSDRHLRTFMLLMLLCGLPYISLGQTPPAVLTDAELTGVVPTSFYFEGQSAPTQMRNSAAARFDGKSYVIVGLVDTSGYSSEVQGKYQGFLITDSPIIIGGTQLGTGAYGFGFSSDEKMNIFDIGGKQILSVKAHHDQELKRPRPLMMVKSADEVRFYNLRNYVLVTAKKS